MPRAVLCKGYINVDDKDDALLYDYKSNAETMADKIKAAGFEAVILKAY